MSMSAEVDPAAVVEAYLDAYDGKRIEAIAELLAPNLRMRHHNRGFDLTGAETLLAGLRQFEEIAPDRRYHSRRRLLVCGEQVVVEHRWEATFLVDAPAFEVKAGETVALDVCSVFTVGDGLILEYDDYG